jgi:hypothetical protein
MAISKLHHSNQRAAHAEAGGYLSVELFSRIECGADSFYLAVSQLMVRIALAATFPFASFGQHIIHIVLVRACKQVLHVAAGWVIAVMKHARRPDAVLQVERNSMSSNHSEIELFSKAKLPIIKSAIDWFVTSSRPYVAIVIGARSIGRIDWTHFFIEPLFPVSHAVTLHWCSGQRDMRVIT